MSESYKKRRDGAYKLDPDGIKNLSFDLRSYVKIETIEPLLKIFKSRLGKAWRKTKQIRVLQLWVYNLIWLKAVSRDGEDLIAIKVSLNKNSYAGTGISYPAMRATAEALEKLGLIRLQRGFYIVSDPAKSQRTRFFVTQDFLALAPLLLGDGDLSRCVEPRTRADQSVILLRDEKKKPIAYTVTDRIQRLLDQLEKVNGFKGGRVTLPLTLGDLQEHLLKKEGVKIEVSDQGARGIAFARGLLERRHVQLATLPCVVTPEARGRDPVLEYDLSSRLTYHRVFNLKWTRGGRFVGSVVQGLSKVLRSKIRIDDAPSAELDFVAMHLSILFHHHLKTDFFGDPYSVPMPSAWTAGEKAWRKAIKIAALVVLNCSSRTSAMKAISLMRHERDLVWSGGYDVGDLLDAFVEHHPALKAYFYTGIGPELQGLESQIAGRVMLAMQKMGIFIMCVHDSFIVPYEHREYLAAYMCKSYQEVCGKNFHPRIKYSD